MAHHITPLFRKKIEIQRIEKLDDYMGDMDENQADTSRNKLDIEGIPKPKDKDLIGVIRCHISEKKAGDKSEKTYALLYYFKTDNLEIPRISNNRTKEFNFYIHYLFIPKSFSLVKYKLVKGKYKLKIKKVKGCSISEKKPTKYSYKGYFAIRLSENSSTDSSDSKGLSHAILLGSKYGCATLISNWSRGQGVARDKMQLVQPTVFYQKGYYYIPLAMETGISIYHRCKPKYITGTLKAIRHGKTKVGLGSPLKVAKGDTEYYYFNKAVYSLPADGNDGNDDKDDKDDDPYYAYKISFFDKFIEVVDS